MRTPANTRTESQRIRRCQSCVYAVQDILKENQYKARKTPLPWLFDRKLRHHE